MFATNRQGEAELSRGSKRSAMSFFYWLVPIGSPSASTDGLYTCLLPLRFRDTKRKVDQVQRWMCKRLV